MAMDTGYLSTQVTTIIGQLHGIFDEIGIPPNEREAKETELFSALSDTLHNHLRQVNAEKTHLTEEAQKIISTVKQMEVSLDDEKNSGDYDLETTGLGVTYPLNDCLRDLKEKYNTMSRLHRDRFQQVKKLVQALESYSLHLESSFIRIKLPPTSSNTCPPNFDLSPRYVATLDEEFSRVYDEYNRRVQNVASTAEDIVRLYSDLGIPQAQTDSTIVQHYRDHPEQLGLHQSDLERLRSKHDKLIDEKRSREKRIKELKSTIEGLWNRLGVEEPDRRAFLAANRGCGLRTINEYEEELSRLNELKRQNLHLFVEDARVRLQELWDALYFSEEEMLEFTPAFSDVYSDALLSAHEAEMERLQALQGQRAPILAVIEKHRSLINDREALASSANDASRLMIRGAKGERRDPTRLLREEKMRKRIAKELPRVTVELRKTLERYEDEYGRPFLVHGDRYLDEIAAAEVKAPPPRSRTPNALPPRSKTPSVNSASASRVNSTAATSALAKARGAHPPPSVARTPTHVAGLAGSLRERPAAMTTQSTSSHVRSPSKIPARAPLTNLNHGGNSPERRTNLPQWSGAQYRTQEPTAEASRMGPPRIPPPKMRDLHAEDSPAYRYHNAPPTRPVSVLSSSTLGSSNNTHKNNGNDRGYVRPVSPEDVYDDRERMSYMSASFSHRDRALPGHQQLPLPPPAQSLRNDLSSSVIRHVVGDGGGEMNTIPHLPALQTGSRDFSNTSSDLMTTGTTASGSENWETYSDVSQIEPPEADHQDVYYAKVRQVTTNPSVKRPGEGFGGAGGGMLAPRPPKLRMVSQESDGHAVMVEGSDAGWTDDSNPY